MVRRHHILEYDSVYTPIPTSPLHFKCTLVSFSFSIFKKSFVVVWKNEIQLEKSPQNAPQTET